MSTAATQQQPPVIPPRPNRSQERDQPGFPKVPPRPSKQRGLSPNPDRYAPSPLNGGIPFKKDRRSSSNSEPIDRSKSVDLPHVVGEEGMEYAALADQLPSPRELGSTSPTQTRTIGEDLKIHAPKAALPPVSAKQRIMQVTRTDSDKAAQFGIGRPSSNDAVPTPSNRSLKKKASTASGLSHSEAEDEERGIPEIGQHVPLLAFAGDVQAPSPAPGGVGSSEQARNHKRKTSSRGLPPGSYGLHGHNVGPQDKLEKEYFQKHPEALKLEHHIYQHDRATDFSMSREQLNKMVRDSEVHGHGVGKYKPGTGPSDSLTNSQGTTDHDGMPSEQAAWAAYSEAASRPHSTKPQEGSSPRRRSSEAGGDVIVVDEPNRRRSVLFSDEAVPAPPQDEVDTDYRAPILAEDEVKKNTPRPDQVPAVELSREGRGSDYDIEPPRSRPTSRPASLYKVDSSEIRSTPLEDVIEYEPLFPEDDDPAKSHNLTAAQIKEMKQRFPSRDIWEDAPNSVHYTAEVSTPEIPEDDIARKVPPREDTETPAHAFARKQEELAEKEHTHPDAFLWRNQKAAWVNHQPHLSHERGAAAAAASASGGAGRPSPTNRFPSRDVWEDTPDSLKLETTVSGPQMEQASPVESAKPELWRPQRKATDPKDKPAVPGRPKPKSASEDAAAAATSKPVIPDRPKPHVPARPAKSVSGSSDGPAAAAAAPTTKAKPAVPARPAGNKIAALQAGFMADLNKKLGLGPVAPKHEDEVNDEEKAAADEPPKEKAPLSDARKGRARGPQRRAPAAASAPAPAVAKSEEGPAAKKPKLSFATMVTVWSIDPDSEGGDALLTEDQVDEKEKKQQPVENVVEAVREDLKAGEDAPRTSAARGELEPAAKAAKELAVPEAVAQPEPQPQPQPEEEERKEDQQLHNPVATKTVPVTTSEFFLLVFPYGSYRISSHRLCEECWRTAGKGKGGGRNRRYQDC